jgi:phage RecT family recombinase
MSNIERFENMKQLVKLAEPDFNELAQIHNAVNFTREASFALEALKNNDYLAKVAMADQDSLRRAVINVAAIGLSLSPVHKHAYLVPRNGKVCLDISYRGCVQLAVDVGSIKWAIAEVVCERDEFLLRGLGQEPLHKFMPFLDRGPIVGAYCVAKTHDGDFLTTSMTIGEILSIRDRTEIWKKSQTGPWKTDESEMIKKTVIKRAYKSWPLTDTRHRLERAIDVSNESDPIDFSPIQEVKDAGEKQSVHAKIRAQLVKLGRPEEKYISHLARTCKREIKSLDDLTEQELGQAVVFLDSLIEKKTAKEAKPNENVG